MLPIIIICGSAGSGKDTIAEYLVQEGGISLAQADRMKVFARMAFGFSINQLWEDRKLKEAIDPRFSKQDAWTHVHEAVSTENPDLRVRNWIRAVLPETRNNQEFAARAERSLITWCLELEKQYRDTGISPRIVLQSLGTQWGRKFSQNMWSDVALCTAVKLLSSPGLRYERTAGVYESPGTPLPSMVVITDGRFANELIQTKLAGGLGIRVDNPDQQAPSTVGIAGHASETEQFEIPNHYFDIILTNDKKAGLEALRQKVATLAAELKHITVIP